MLIRLIVTTANVWNLTCWIAQVWMTFRQFPKTDSSLQILKVRQDKWNCILNWWHISEIFTTQWCQMNKCAYKVRRNSRFAKKITWCEKNGAIFAKWKKKLYWSTFEYFWNGVVDQKFAFHHSTIVHDRKTSLSI